MSDSPWAKRLLPASFRGIPFFVDAHEFEGGRNAISHEPPDKNSGFAEDIGRKTNGYKISAHLLGDAYFFLRDALIDAMEEPERGVLIHPYLGALEVQPGPYKLSETSEEGRLCRFDLSFVEAGDPSFPFAAIDAITKFATKAFATVAQVQNAFNVAVALTGIPSYLVAAVDETVVGFIKTVKNGLKTVSANAKELAEFNKKLAQFEAQWKNLIKEPETMSFTVNELTGALVGVVADPPDDSAIDTGSGKDQKLDIFKPLIEFKADFDLTILPTDTPTKAAGKLFNKSFVDLVNQLAIVNFANQAAGKLFKNVESAIDKRAETTGYMDGVMAGDIDDALFGSFKDLKAATVDVIPNPTAKLSTVANIEIYISMPALVLAYDLYLNLENERDIIDRNGIRNPSFVAGKLAVLSGG